MRAACREVWHRLPNTGWGFDHVGIRQCDPWRRAFCDWYGSCGQLCSAGPVRECGSGFDESLKWKGGGSQEARKKDPAKCGGGTWGWHTVTASGGGSLRSRRLDHRAGFGPASCRFSVSSLRERVLKSSPKEFIPLACVHNHYRRLVGRQRESGGTPAAGQRPQLALPTRCTFRTRAIIRAIRAPLRS